MIDEQEQKYLVNVLIDEIAGGDALRTTLCMAVLDTDFSGALTLSSMPATVIAHAVSLCADDRWNHAPPWLAQLIGSAFLAFRVKTDMRLQAIRDLAANPAPQADPNSFLNATLLNRGTPFVNRRKLRNNLAYLETKAARDQPILVVNGAGTVGKSYTSRYVEHFAFSQSGALRIACHRFEFKPDFALSLGAQQLAKDLVYSLARPFDAEPAPETNQKLYARQLAAWVLSEAVKTGARHWFVLDGFSADPQLPETHQPRVDTLDFLVELSNLVTGGSYVEQCRLILTGFDRALLTVDPGKVEVETVTPCTRDDARQCLKEVLQQALLPLPLALVEPLVLDDLPKGADRMPELNLRLRALLQAMKDLPEILQRVPDADYAEVLVDMLSDLPPGKQRLQQLTLRLDALRAAALEDQ